MSELAAERVLALEHVSVWMEDRTVILSDISWSVRAGEHWAVLGPNGAGKTTLFTVATARRYPSRGTVEVLGRRFGEASMLELREHISIVDPHQRMYVWFTVEEIVLTGVTGTVQPLPDRYTDEDRARAARIMEQVGMGGMADREIQSCSQGERQRVRVARALMTRPRLLVLDEPASGRDLPAREALIASLTDLEKSDPDLASMMVSHHLEELPPTITHALLLRDGRIVACGTVDDVLTDAAVSDAFGIPVRVSRQEGRWAARGVATWR
jgi:iron complex transport system ATP-binding protein